jgi:hypothetical protein
MGLSLVIFMFIFLFIGPIITVPFPVYISAAFSIFVGVFIYHLGVSAEFFSKIITSVTDEIEIKWLTTTIKIKDTYITYFSAVNPYSFWIIFTNFIYREEIPPEHFQVWRVTSWPITISESPIDHREYLLESRGLLRFIKRDSSENPREIINRELLPYLPERMPDLPHLKCIELARWKNENILVVFLDENATIEEFKLIFLILDQIEKKIEEDN